MVGALKDPYADYLSPESLADMEKQIGGSLVGIGVQLEIQDQQIRVVTPLPGSPALAVGIRAGDVLLEIDGNSLAGLELREVVKRIAGPKDSSVRLRIRRESSEPLTISVSRGAITVPTLKGLRRGMD